MYDSYKRGNNRIQMEKRICSSKEPGPWVKIPERARGICPASVMDDRRAHAQLHPWENTSYRHVFLFVSGQLRSSGPFEVKEFVFIIEALGCVWKGGWGAVPI